MKSIILSATFVLLLVLPACVFLKPDYVTEITPQELAEAMTEKDIFLVDVHIPEQRHIKGTDLFVPYNTVSEHLDLFPANKSTPVYLYCEGGPMGNAAARTLYNAGYKKIYNLKGGADAWFKEGLEKP